MQLYQPLEPEDKTLIHAIEADAKDTKKYCAQFTGAAHNACVKESWPAIENSASDPKVFEALCTQLTDPEAVRYCAEGLMYPVIEVLRYDVPAIQNFCRGIEDSEIRNICWARAASKFIWADRSNTEQAIAMCVAAPDGSKPACWNELINYAEFGMQKNSPGVKKLCADMPMPFKDTCVSRTQSRQ